MCNEQLKWWMKGIYFSEVQYVIYLLDSRWSQLFSFFFFLRFYLFTWERECEKQTPHWAGSPRRGSIPGPWDHDMSWNKDSKSWGAWWHSCWVSDSRFWLRSWFFFFKDFIYLFDRETASERGNTSRGSGRGRSRLLAEEPDVGLDLRTLGSRPEPNADA